MEKRKCLYILSKLFLIYSHDAGTHRVDKVLGFFSSRSNWDPHPFPQVNVSPPLFPGRAHSLAGEGVGGSQLDEGDRQCCTAGMCLYFVPVPNLF